MNKARWKSLAIYAALCVPFLVVYWFVFRLQDAQSTPLHILWMAFTNVAAPAVLGPIVWWVTARLPVPTRFNWKFVFAHLSMLAMFVALWVSWVYYLIVDIPAAYSRMVPFILPWQAVMAIYMYGLIVGVSYTVRGLARSRHLALMAERAERLRSQAELAALRAHINPHFLFNTLHTVTALLRTNPELAEQALDRLSGLLRYALRLDRNDVELVTLEEEWDFVEGYLWLERLRMGDRLRVNSSFDDESLACAVPPFTLQPLVENAVRHGLAPKVGGGSLHVSAREQNGMLHIEVRDDGVGAPADSDGKGLGVRAVSQRLEARHGSAAHAEAGNSDGGGYVVRLALPAEGVPVGAHSVG